MILNEQKYNSKTRLWYHGTDDFNMSKRRFPFTFLTSSIEYALRYTKNLNIVICTLTAPLNIFNALSKIDRATLKIKAKQRGFDIDDETMGILAEQDWFNCKWPRSGITRIIKESGYDGFSNFESGYGHKNPSIGIFDVNVIKVRKFLNKEDLLKYGPAKEAIHNHRSKCIEVIKYNAFYDKTHNKVADIDDLLSIEQIAREVKFFNSNEDLYEIYIRFMDNNVEEATKLFESAMEERFQRHIKAPWTDERYMSQFFGK